MGATTKIPWTGSTWNIMRGCRRKDAGCLNCYAERQAIRGSGPGGPYEGLVRMTYNGPRWTGEVRFDEDALGEPASWQEPRMVFVNSMSDLFYERFTDEQAAAVVGAMILAPLHVYQVLTKREVRCKSFFENVTPTGCIAAARAMGLRLSARQSARTFALLPDAHPLRPLFRPKGVASCPLPFDPEHRRELAALAWPMPHLWFGASCNDQPSFDERAPIVRGFIGGAVRFLSLEPLTGPIVLGDALRERRRYAQKEGADHVHTPPEAARCSSLSCGGLARFELVDRSIGWLIPGGESGPKARLCVVRWVRDVLREAATAGSQCDLVDVFVKQLGARALDEASGLVGAKLAPCDMGGLVDAGGPPLVKLRLKSSKGEDPAEWPDDLLVQDYPRGVYLPAIVEAA